jgi:hypothetical protein
MSCRSYEEPEGGELEISGLALRVIGKAAERASEKMEVNILRFCCPDRC